MIGWGRKCVSNASESLQLHRCCACSWTYKQAQLLRPNAILLWDIPDLSWALHKEHTPSSAGFWAPCSSLRHESTVEAPVLCQVSGALLF